MNTAGVPAIDGMRYQKLLQEVKKKKVVPKSPQSVISKMRLCGSKNLSTLQPPVGQFATGVPSVEVSMLLAFELKTLGTWGR